MAARRDRQAQGQGRGARAKLRAATALEERAGRCQKVCEQIGQRVRGEKITNRLISLSDPDARPIRKGKLGKPNEFASVTQIAQVTATTKPGARGLIVPASSQIGNPVENRLLPRPSRRPSNSKTSSPRGCSLRGQQPGSRRTQRRLQRYRTGAEGRISALKRGYGMRHSPLKRRSEPADLDRIGHPGLQPRHPHHPDRLTHFPTLPPEHQPIPTS